MISILNCWSFSTKKIQFNNLSRVQTNPNFSTSYMVKCSIFSSSSQNPHLQQEKLSYCLKSYLGLLNLQFQLFPLEFCFKRFELKLYPFLLQLFQSDLFQHFRQGFRDQSYLVDLQIADLWRHQVLKFQVLAPLSFHLPCQNKFSSLYNEQLFLLSLLLIAA